MSPIATFAHVDSETVLFVAVVAIMVAAGRDGGMIAPPTNEKKVAHDRIRSS